MATGGTCPTCGQAVGKAVGNRQYSEEFESAWRAYPRRAGANPKWSAYRAWRGRLKEGVAVDVMQDGVARYADYCQASGKTGTEYVMRAERFFGPNEEFRDEWAVAGSGRAAPESLNGHLLDLIDWRSE